MAPNRFLRLLIALLFVLALVMAPLAGATEQEEPAQEEEAAVEESCAALPLAAIEIDPSCPDRDHIVRCAAEYLDKNKNGLLERSELQDVIDALPWYARGVLKILGSVDKIMGKCDVDGDDAIGIDYDMQHNKETCLATCFKRRAFKAAFFPECDL